MKDEKTKTIFDFTGVTAFLCGLKGMDEHERLIHDKMIKAGCIVKVLDNLYENPKPLENLRPYENIVVDTTGTYKKELSKLMGIFINSKVIPQNVVFLSESSAMAFLSIARMLKDFGTNFYFIDYYSCELYDIPWI